jgi:hypothetical protein
MMKVVDGKVVDSMVCLYATAATVVAHDDEKDNDVGYCSILLLIPLLN